MPIETLIHVSDEELVAKVEVRSADGRVLTQEDTVIEMRLAE